MNTKNNAKGNLTKTGTIVAIVLVVLWVALGVMLFLSVGADETTWARYVWLFSSVEAVAFAAVGALLGTTVQKQRVQDAQNRADDATKDANNGRLLAERVKRLQPSSIKSGVERLSASGGDSDINEVINLANNLFPD
jgi:flagellar biosynthesis/type III secretory pathway M-ring protein FliF/YscJ